MKRANNLILNGFDRCGSSAIGRVLATHPQVELIFHPFNSGSIRRKMYQVMTDEIASEDDVRFFSELEQGRFWRDYIVSPWFEKHSTVLDFLHNRLHVLKTTLNHLTIRWIRERFPDIEFWGIWRDPFDILASLVRNQFFGKWYLDALPQLAETMKGCGDFPSQFVECMGLIEKSEVKALAFLIATRSYFFFKYLEAEKLINYEVFKVDPNAELNKITQHFGLEVHSFEGESNRDYNVIGLGYEKGMTYRHLIGEEDGSFAKTVFAPLFTLVERRFEEKLWQNLGNQEMGAYK